MQMRHIGNPVLVLALGNDLLGDDAVALRAARELQRRDLRGIDVIESGEAGFALLELITDYERVLVIDAMYTRRHPVGTIIHFSDHDFDETASPSPHYAALPDLRRMADAMDIPYPREIEIIAMEVADPYSIKEELTQPVQAALPAYVHEIIRSLKMKPARRRVSNDVAGTGKKYIPEKNVIADGLTFSSQHR
jgi:hydrogenase maturation protease